MTPFTSVRKVEWVLYTMIIIETRNMMTIIIIVTAANVY